MFVVSCTLAASAQIRSPCSSLKQKAYKLNQGLPFNAPSVLYLTYHLGGNSHNTVVYFTLGFMLPISLRIIGQLPNYWSIFLEYSFGISDFQQHMHYFNHIMHYSLNICLLSFTIASVSPPL